MLLLVPFFKSNALESYLIGKLYKTSSGKIREPQENIDSDRKLILMS